MIRFDTLDKKPKLYNLAFLTAAFAVLIAVMAFIDAEGLSVPICAAVIAYLVLAEAALINAFIGQLRYNPYSYNTIYYIGFALFVLSLIATLVVLLVRMIRAPELYALSQILHVFLNSAKWYMFISAPFILVFSAALFVSNISLLLHERRRFVNVLGILLALLLVAGETLLFFYDRYAAGSQFEVMMHDLVGNLFAAVYLYFECMLIGAIIANIIVVRYEPEKDKDYLIILGCGLRRDGTPTPLLRGRVERAVAFYEKQKAETGRELMFITSGGQGPDEANSESLAMKRCLMEHGIPEDRIIEEDASRDTFENMKFSKEKIWERDPDAKIAFSTTNYHIFRSGIFARRVKMRAVGMGAKTKWYFWPNAAVREFVGLLTAHRLKQAVVLGSMVAAYVVMTIIAYR
ncbi:MAG: YdcF family protein [Clostridia bacterium]|nr:YdcF family protein [Clostridia bacterium]